MNDLIIDNKSKADKLKRIENYRIRSAAGVHRMEKGKVLMSWIKIDPVK